MTHTHKFKCLSCGLHFALYSWYEERDPSKTACPECHTIGNLMHWYDTSERQVFEFIPGSAELKQIGQSKL